MATLKIHDKGIDIENWSRTAKLDVQAIGTIKDFIQTYGGGKIASSIPSPFARMLLFDSAFEYVSHKNLEGDSPYHKLVAEALDLAQLVFMRGNSGEMRFVHYDLDRQVEELKLSESEGHRILASALGLSGNSFKGLSYSQNSEIDKIHFDKLTLIYYNDILVGGTSPYTLFFTSPNWERQSRHLNISASNQMRLFRKPYIPLLRRDEDFQLFMNHFMELHRDILELHSAHLLRYIEKTMDISNVISSNTAPAMTIHQYASQYSPIRYEAGTLMIGEMPYHSVHIAEMKQYVQQTSDFIIKNTVNHFKKDPADFTPMALSPGNWPGYLYIRSNWDENIEVADNDPEPIENRLLPGGVHLNYPVLYANDFLEEYLVELKTSCNANAFYLMNLDSRNFLYPVKSEYFKYFTLQDLVKYVKLKKVNDGIQVEIEIPLAKSKSIYFKKIYDDDSKIVTFGTFEMGISPFYKTEPDYHNYNNYATIWFGLQDELNPANLRIAYQSFDKTDDGLKYIADLRQQDGISYWKMIHSLNHGAFDYIKISTELDNVGYSSLLIPKWKEVSLNKGSVDYYFGIDFGTSNTSVSYSSNRGNAVVAELSYEENEFVTFLTGSTPYSAFHSHAIREFMPNTIGLGSDIVFPAKTAILETLDFPNKIEPKLFVNANIGFFYNNEVVIEPHLQYLTDVKWMLEKQPFNVAHKHRVRIYFEQLFTLIKHKIIANQGSLTRSKIMWFYPSSMKNVLVIFENEIQNAFSNVFPTGFPRPGIESMTEEQAPYEELKTTENIGGAAVLLNIDIGGGTTDMMYFDNTLGGSSSIGTSFKFAGNHIWGDKLNTCSKDNGFLRIINMNNCTDPKVKQMYGTLLNRENTSSADLTSFLFKHDKLFGFSDSIRFHDKMRLVLALHYCSIIYTIGRFLAHNSLRIPNFITFTGKGSEYIKLLFANNGIAPVTRSILEYTISQKTPNLFKVIMASNPKVITARGGVRVLMNANHRNSLSSIPWVGIEHRSNEHGFNKYTLSEIEKFRETVFSEYEEFLDYIIGDQVLKEFLIASNIKFSLMPEIKQKLLEYSISSFENSEVDIQGAQNLAPDEPLVDCMFLWPLKESLYELSKLIMEDA